MRSPGARVPLLLLLVLSLPYPPPAGAGEILTATHALDLYAADGPTMTVTFTLELQNIGDQDLYDLTISPAHVFNSHLSAVEEFEPLVVGTLPPQEAASLPYTFADALAEAEEHLASSPIYWNVFWETDLGQSRATLIVSSPEPPAGAP